MPYKNPNNLAFWENYWIGGRKEERGWECPKCHKYYIHNSEYTKKIHRQTERHKRSLKNAGQ